MTVYPEQTEFSTAVQNHLRPGMTVALGDGVGAPRCLDDGASVCATLSAVARRIGGIRLVVGWVPAPLQGLEADAFAEVVAIMPGWGPSTTNGRSPFVEQLSRPASTPAYDIDLIVTESGHADLRGADWNQRRRLIAALFG